MFIRRPLRGLRHVSVNARGGSPLVSSFSAAASPAAASASGGELGRHLLKEGTHFSSADLHPAVGVFRRYFPVGKFATVVGVPPFGCIGLTISASYYRRCNDLFVMVRHQLLGFPNSARSRFRTSPRLLFG